MPVHRDPVEATRHRAAVWLLIAATTLAVAVAVWFLWWLRHGLLS
jgi:hypothetical protein